MFSNYPDPQVKKQIGTLTQIFYQFQDDDQEDTTNQVETEADTDTGAIYGNFLEFDSH
jgi:hypothetical protein